VVPAPGRRHGRPVTSGAAATATLETGDQA
jgi:hypothetical protein